MRKVPVDPNVSPEPAGPTQADQALIQRLQGIQKLVMGCHARMGGPLGPEDLDEAIQETSLTAWRRRLEFRGESDLDTWLYGIARFTILARLRRRRSQEWHESCLVDVPEARTTERGPGTLADTGMVRVVAEGLDDAGTTVAEILRRRVLMGMSFVKISEDLAANEANVKARYYRSLPRLRRRLRGLWSDLGRS